MPEEKNNKKKTMTKADAVWFISKIIVIYLIDMILLLGSVAVAVMSGAALVLMDHRLIALPAGLAVGFGLTPGRNMVFVKLAQKYLAPDVRTFGIDFGLDEKKR